MIYANKWGFFLENPENPERYAHLGRGTKAPRTGQKASLIPTINKEDQHHR